MSLFERLETSIFAIKNNLLENEKIKKLLYYSSPDALNRADISKLDVEKNILTVPFLDVKDPDNGINLNTIIAVYPTRVFHEEAYENSIYIKTAIYTKASLYNLNNNKMRLNQLAKEITSEIKDRKFALAGTMILTESEWVTLDGIDKVGLILHWTVVDD